MVVSDGPSSKILLKPRDFVVKQLIYENCIFFLRVRIFEIVLKQ